MHHPMIGVVYLAVRVAEMAGRRIVLRSERSEDFIDTTTKYKDILVA